MYYCSPSSVIVNAILEELPHRVLELEQTIYLHLQLDSVGVADYALGSAGAHIVDSLTSPTYTGHLVQQKSYLSGAALQIKPPMLALMPEVHSGYCWAMAGSRGTLGVMLAHTIIPHSFTIDHVAKPLSLQYSSAPKEVEVWALVERAGGLPNESLPTCRGSELLHRRGSKYQDTTFIRLVNFTYDIHASRPTQTFFLQDSIRSQNIPIEVVVFRFKSNWGHDPYTCIYRVRAHGENVSNMEED
ncbi:hypothetical protein C8Q76DRAFT_617326 [Earliella scabrosa]|nr:hypothetical protein C8Q76DRAFT_617326 [Earliella scabrosa]